DGFASYQPIENLVRAEAMFALDMGIAADALAPLPVDHGFPCRILTPGLYGYMQPKWIDSVTFVDGGAPALVSTAIPYFDGHMQLASGFSRPRGGTWRPGTVEL